MVTALDRQGFLQSLAWDAQDRGVSLFSLLKAAVRGKVTDAGTGRQIVSSSGNGRSVAFTIPDFFSALTADDLRRTFVELLNIYAAAVTTLGIATPAVTDATHDAAILATMLASDSMQPVTEWQNDYTNLRLAYTR